ncbi:HNH endonuclease [Nitrobacter sp. TKz-YC01]|uniref:HNH endonuclease n=1 Tax=Nitrobacter sp. TKz-YC01 TaxID=3398703 RepID=UPI003A0FDB6F
MAFRKGNIPWNKGISGAQVPWNKGIPQWKDKRHPRLGTILSEATKQKISRAAMGNKRRLGCKLSAKAKKQISIAKTGKKLPPFSDQHRRRIGDACRGERNYAWKGGVASYRLSVWRSKEYQDWRRSVFERDNYTCQECGARNGKGRTVVLNADHIKQFALYPALRFALNNGRTLCLPCHRQTPTYGRRVLLASNKHA